MVAAENLIKEGVQPGRNMGILLKEAESLAILHNLHDKEAVMHLLKTTVTWKKLVENSSD